MVDKSGIQIPTVRTHAHDRRDVIGRDRGLCLLDRDLLPGKAEVVVAGGIVQLEMGVVEGDEARVTAVIAVMMRGTGHEVEVGNEVGGRDVKRAFG